MALIKCPECGKQVSDKAEFCPNCGYPISKKVNTTVRIKVNAPELSPCFIHMRPKAAKPNQKWPKVWTGSYGSIATLHIDEPTEIYVSYLRGGGTGREKIEPGKSYQLIRRQIGLLRSAICLEEIDLAL